MRRPTRRSLLFDRLPVHEREVLEQRIHAGRSVEETAVALGLTVSEVRERQWSAVRRMLDLAPADDAVTPAPAGAA